jgi:hypothetical protein
LGAKIGAAIDLGEGRREGRTAAAAANPGPANKTHGRNMLWYGAEYQAAKRLRRNSEAYSTDQFK